MASDKKATPPASPQKLPTGRVLVIQTISFIKNGGITPVTSDRRFSTQIYDNGMTLDYDVELTKTPHKVATPPVGKIGRIAIVHLGGESPIMVGGFKVNPGGAMHGEPEDPDNIKLSADDRGAKCRITVFPA